MSNLTSDFRPPGFSHLSGNYMPRKVLSRRHGEIRNWVRGCASGALCSLQETIHTAAWASGQEPYRITGDESETLANANRFLRAIHLRGLSIHTVRAYGYDLVLILRWLHETKRCMKDLTCSNSTIFIIALLRLSASRPMQPRSCTTPCDSHNRNWLRRPIPLQMSCQNKNSFRF